MGLMARATALREPRSLLRRATYLRSLAREQVRAPRRDSTPDRSPNPRGRSAESLISSIHEALDSVGSGMVAPGRLFDALDSVLGVRSAALLLPEHNGEDLEIWTQTGMDPTLARTLRLSEHELNRLTGDAGLLVGPLPEDSSIAISSGKSTTAALLRVPRSGPVSCALLILDADVLSLPDPELRLVLVSLQHPIASIIRETRRELDLAPRSALKLELGRDDDGIVEFLPGEPEALTAIPLRIGLAPEVPPGIDALRVFDDVAHLLSAMVAGLGFIITAPPEQLLILVPDSADPELVREQVKAMLVNWFSELLVFTLGAPVQPAPQEDGIVFATRVLGA